MVKEPNFEYPVKNSRRSGSGCVPGSPDRKGGKEPAKKREIAKHTHTTIRATSVDTLEWPLSALAWPRNSSCAIKQFAREIGKIKSTKLLSYQNLVNNKET